jgi:SagB-type dehydrogenase family enzyme|uniref:SagB/ThcOx family dehydrogenase n=1 Tax=Desulfomonile tiedjei TaxID=2358 RepID=A0A7C4APV4_9BACT
MRKAFVLPLAAAFIGLGIWFTASAMAQTQIQLPKPSLTGKMPVETAMAKKKSVRAFSAEGLSQSQVSQLLWSANGDLPVDAVASATTKVLPSAGGLYPLEVFLLTGANTVEGIPAGVYKYNPATHTLSLVAAGDSRQALAQAAFSQTWLARAPAILVIGAVFARTTAKYGNRGIQYVFMEAGNSNQNIYLEAEALGLKTATVGAFHEAQVSSVLNLPADVTPLLLMGVGK